MPDSQPEINTEHLVIRHMGTQDYETVWRQMQTFTLSRTENSKDELWILQHEPVFTLGQAGLSEHILNAHSIPVLKSDRGGQVTYHGPGQLVIYLMIDVRRNNFGVRHLVDLIESSIISVLDQYGVKGETKARAPGVYVADRKIAALGLRIKKGCSYHGLSFNIDMDLTPFSYINPCGYAGLEVTQLKDLLAQPSDKLFTETQQRLVKNIAESLL